MKERHLLTENQLEELFRKLVEAGVITHSEIDSRKSLFAEEIEWPPGSDRPAPITPQESWSRPEDGHPPGTRVKAGPLDHPPANLGRNAAIGIVVGIIVTLAGRIVVHAGHDYAAIGLLLGLVGFAVFMWGCYCLVKKKGYHGAFTLFGLLGCIGLLVPLLIPDKFTGKTTRGTAIIVAVVAGFVLTAIIGIVLAIGIPYYVSFKRTACDRMAMANVSKLGAALERFANERFDHNCGSGGVTPETIKYIVGPYYGWGGTNRQCSVNVRVVGNEVHGCAMKGSKPGRPAERYIYRVRLDSGADLPMKIGPCSGQSYGGSNGTCYDKSILDSECNLVRPKGIKCVYPRRQ